MLLNQLTTKNVNKPTLTEKDRIMLIDWLIIVVEKLSLSDEIFITTIRLFDLFIKRIKESEYSLDIKQLSLSFNACLYLAIKYFQRGTFTIKFMVEIVCHNEFSIQELCKMEIFVLKMLKFKIPNIYEHDLLKDLENDDEFSSNLRKMLLKFYVRNNVLFMDDVSMEKEFSDVILLIKKLSQIRNRVTLSKLLIKLKKMLFNCSYSIKGSNFEKFILNPFWKKYCF